MQSWKIPVRRVNRVRVAIVRAVIAVRVVMAMAVVARVVTVAAAVTVARAVTAVVTVDHAAKVAVHAPSVRVAAMTARRRNSRPPF